MPYIAGDGSAANPIQKLLIGNGAGGTVAIQKVIAGTGSSYAEVWPGKKVFADNFDRADVVLGTNQNWYTIGTNPYYIWVVGNNVRVFDNTTDGQRLSWTSWMEDTNTESHYSKGKLINIGNASRGFWVLCNANQAGTDHVGFQWTGTTLQLFTRINDVTTARGTSATRTQVVGDWIEIRSVINPSTGIFTYNGYVNGSLLCSWTDSTSLAKKGAGYKRVGFGLSRNRSAFVSTFSTQFSEWEGGDN